MHVRLRVARKPTLGEKKRVAHNRSVPTLPPSSSRLFATPLYTGGVARVCHWEFPKYISPVRPIVERRMAGIS